MGMKERFLLAIFGGPIASIVLWMIREFFIDKTLEEMMGFEFFLYSLGPRPMFGFVAGLFVWVIFELFFINDGPGVNKPGKYN